MPEPTLVPSAWAKAPQFGNDDLCSDSSERRRIAQAVGRVGRCDNVPSRVIRAASEWAVCITFVKRGWRTVITEIRDFGKVMGSLRVWGSEFKCSRCVWRAERWTLGSADARSRSRRATTEVNARESEMWESSSRI